MTKRIGERDVIITEIELENGVSTGINLRKLGTGLVPVFEEQATRDELRLSLEDWYKLSELERALMIARRRISMQMQNLQTEAEIAKMKREARKK